MPALPTPPAPAASLPVTAPVPSSPVSPQQRKDELRKSWYTADQVTALKKHYLKELRGVKVYGCATTPDEMGQIVQHNTADVANFTYLIGKHPDTHFVDITIAKDPRQPGRVLALTQDSEGCPIPAQIKQALTTQLIEKYGKGNVEFSDCAVKQQGNNIDCGPLTVTNAVDNVARILKCYKVGKSIIEAATQDDKSFFSSRLSIQSPQNLSDLRREHYHILKGLDMSAGNLIIKRGSLAAQEELKAGATRFDYKRKKPLCQDDFTELHHVEKKKHTLLKWKNPGDKVAQWLEKFFAKLMKTPHLEDPDAPPSKASKPAGGPGGGGTDVTAQVQQEPSKAIPDHLQQAAANLPLPNVSSLDPKLADKVTAQKSQSQSFRQP